MAGLTLCLTGLTRLWVLEVPRLEVLGWQQEWHSTGILGAKCQGMRQVQFWEGVKEFRFSGNREGCQHPGGQRAGP